MWVWALWVWALWFWTPASVVQWGNSLVVCAKQVYLGSGQVNYLATKRLIGDNPMSPLSVPMLALLFRQINKCKGAWIWVCQWVTELF